MVEFETNPVQIAKLLTQYFDLDSRRYTINNGVVDVPDWSVRSLSGLGDHLPVQFGYVGGFFDVSGAPLKSLHGCPHTTGSGFFCRNTQISNLVGGPQSVGAEYWCTENPRLESLEGCPEHLDGMFICRYSTQLPLLRLLAYKKIHVQKLPPQASKILDKYQGTTNPGDVLKCASELTEHGFEGNAEW